MSKFGASGCAPEGRTFAVASTGVTTFAAALAAFVSGVRASDDVGDDIEDDPANGGSLEALAVEGTSNGAVCGRLAALLAVFAPEGPILPGCAANGGREGEGCPV